MRINVLTDNHALRKFSAEWGLSLYIEGSKNVLLDFGDSDLYLKNAQKLGLDVLKADCCVLSHGHWDHGNGLQYISEKKLICHPDSFIKRYRKNGEYIGLPYTLEQAQERFTLTLSKEPFYIDESIIFLGEIPRKIDFESKETTFIKEDGSPDFIIDDSGLAIKTEKGLVVISGCAHAGICNTIEYAKEICNTEKVYAVFGGFHLKGQDEVTTKTIEYLKKLDIDIIRTTHCTEFPALVQFANAFGSMPLHSGLVLDI